MASAFLPRSACVASVLAADVATRQSPIGGRFERRRLSHPIRTRTSLQLIPPVGRREKLRDAGYNNWPRVTLKSSIVPDSARILTLAYLGLKKEMSKSTIHFEASFLAETGKTKA